jgi:hypothetical protein
MAVKNARIGLEGRGDWSLSGAVTPAVARQNEPIVSTLTLRVPEKAPVTRPYWSRRSIQESRYTIDDENQRQFGEPWPEPPLVALGRYEVDGVNVTVRRPVTRFEANLPRARLRSYRRSRSRSRRDTASLRARRLLGASP